MGYLHLARVPSLTTPGRAYGVEQRGAVWICECPAFAFGKGKDRTCKHLRIYRAAEKLAWRCQEIHGNDGAGLCRQCLVSLLATAAAKVARERKGRSNDASKGIRRCQCARSTTK